MYVLARGRFRDQNFGSRAFVHPEPRSAGRDMGDPYSGVLEGRAEQGLAFSKALLGLCSAGEAGGPPGLFHPKRSFSRRMIGRYSIRRADAWP